ARDTLHDEVVHAVLLAYVVYRGDVGEAQLRQRQGFLAKAPAALLACHQAGREYFDSYDTFQLLIACAVYRAHTTGPNRLDDGIAPQSVARSQNLPTNRE